MATYSKPPSFNVSFFDEQLARKNFNRVSTHVVAYARLSFDEDGANFCSIVNQRDILTNYYWERLASESSTFSFIADDNVSGYKFERDGLFNLFRKIEMGECNVIIAKDLSRLGRHGALIQLFIEQCERVGVRIIAMEDYDSRKQSDELILGIRAWSNERLVKDTSIKIKKIIDHKQKDGTWICAVPYGYICKNFQEGIVEIDEEVEEIIHRIDRMYLEEDMGCKSIAKVLTLEHVKTPSQRLREINISLGRRTNGKTSDKWSAGQIYKILNDDFYTGTLRTGKYTRAGINGHDSRRDPSQHNVFEDHHVAIRSKETFKRIQQKMFERRTTNARATKHAPNKYRGLMRCGDCGASMIVINDKRSAQHYVCGNYYRLGKEFCSRHSTKTSTIDAIVLALLSSIKENCGDIVESLDKELKAARKNAKSTSQILSDLRDKRNSLISEIEVIEVQRIKRITTNPDREAFFNELYDKMLLENQQALSNLDSRIQELEDIAATHATTTKDLKKAADIIDQIISTGDVTRNDAELLFKKITVYSDGRIAVDLKPYIPFIKNPSIITEDEPSEQLPQKNEAHSVNEVQDGDPSTTSFMNLMRRASLLASLAKQLKSRRLS